MIHVRQITVTVTQSAVKEVRCEHCGCEFVYGMSATERGTGTDVMFLDGQGARERAACTAAGRAKMALRLRCSPVPCPDCGWYQADMVEELKQRRLSRLVVFVLLPALGLCAILWSAREQVAGWDDRSIGLVLLGILCAAVVAVAILARRWDPNGDAQARLMPSSVETGRAMRRAEFEEVRRSQAEASENEAGVEMRRQVGSDGSEDETG